LSDEAAAVLAVCPELADAEAPHAPLSSLRSFAWRARRTLKLRFGRSAHPIGRRAGRRALAMPLVAMHLSDMVPEAMQLRYLQTLANIAGDKSSTIVFPLPIDLLSAMASKRTES
jgi:hypothetical protein